MDCGVAIGTVELPTVIWKPPVRDAVPLFTLLPPCKNRQLVREYLED